MGTLVRAGTLKDDKSLVFEKDSKIREIRDNLKFSKIDFMCIFLYNQAQ